MGYFVRDNRFSQEEPTLPPSINVAELLELAKKRGKAPNFEEKMLKKLRNSKMWAALYVWLCAAIETSQTRQIKFKAAAVSAALHANRAKTQLDFLAFYVFKGFLDRQPKDKWRYYYVNKGELLNYQAMQIAAETLGAK